VIFTGLLRCNTCKKVLNHCRNVHEGEDKERQTAMRIYNAPACCTPLKHGMNFDTHIEWVEQT